LSILIKPGNSTKRNSVGSAFEKDMGHVILLRFYASCMISIYAKQLNEHFILAGFFRKQICMVINQIFMLL
jgi:hypothetical protein